jgi:hypothetical protein
MPDKVENLLLALKLEGQRKLAVSGNLVQIRLTGNKNQNYQSYNFKALSSANSKDVFRSGFPPETEEHSAWLTPWSFQPLEITE